MSKMKALRPEEMVRAKRARPLPLDASWSTGDEAFDARIHAGLMQRDEALDALEEMRLRAESAEARIATVSGVTREELAKREYERGAESQLDAFADALADLYVAWCALQTQHAEQHEALRAEMQSDVMVLREALEEIAGTYDDGAPAQVIAEDALAALEEP